MLRTALDDTQEAALRQLARRAVGRVSERAHFVLLSAQGHAPREIGTLLGYRTGTVRHWLKRYRRWGLEGLEDAPRSGRPPKDPLLTGIVQAQAGQSPAVFGYLRACWTVALLVTHLRERLHLSVGATTLRQALRQAGFRWTRPKWAMPHKPDPRTEAKRQRLSEALGDPEATVLAEDESEVHLLPVLRAMWQRLGQQGRLRTPGSNAKRGVFGALDLRSGAWHYILTARRRAVEFVAFLEGLLQACPLGRIYVIVDNAGIHTSRSVRAWLEGQSRLELVYLPTYSGHQLNPVEKVWWALKDVIAANRSFRSLAEVDWAIGRFFGDLTPKAALRLTNNGLTREAQAAAKSDANLL